MLDLLEHEELAVIKQGLPENGPQATVYKRVFQHLPFESMHDIWDILLALNAVIRTMTKIMVKRQVKLNQEK
mgnify:FL=1